LNGGDVHHGRFSPERVNDEAASIRYNMTGVPHTVRRWRTTSVFRVHFKVFRSSFSSWETLFREAADFASTVPTDRLISISHSEDQNEGVVSVWYWDDGPLPAAEPE
jgi:hypothetical protein